MEDPRERLARFMEGVERLGQSAPGAFGTFGDFAAETMKDGALTTREKELVAIGVSLYTGCEDCVVVHTYKALEAGCTRQEIIEAAATAMVFGGGPILGRSATELLRCLDAFESVPT